MTLKVAPAPDRQLSPAPPVPETVPVAGTTVGVRVGVIEGDGVPVGVRVGVTEAGAVADAAAVRVGVADPVALGDGVAPGVIATDVDVAVLVGAGLLVAVSVAVGVAVAVGGAVAVAVTVIVWVAVGVGRIHTTVRQGPALAGLFAMTARNEKVIGETGEVRVVLANRRPSPSQVAFVQ